MIEAIGILAYFAGCTFIVVIMLNVIGGMANIVTDTAKEANEAKRRKTDARRYLRARAREEEEAAVERLSKRSPPKQGAFR